MQAKIVEIEFGGVSGSAFANDKIAIPSLNLFERILKAKNVVVTGYNVAVGEHFPLRAKKLHDLLLASDKVDVLALVNDNGEQKILFSINDDVTFEVREDESVKIAKMALDPDDVFADAKQTSLNEVLETFGQEDE